MMSSIGTVSENLCMDPRSLSSSSRLFRAHFARNFQFVFVFCCLTALVGLPLCVAQDRNYWNTQVGTRSALMGGAVVGGVRDTSATYYNPGALGFITNSSLSVSANAYQYDRFRSDNGVGQGEALTSDEIRVYPLLVSGAHVIDDGEVLGYSVITRNNFGTKMSARHDVTGDILTNPSAPGLEEFIGQYTLESSLSEYWGALSYAHRLNECTSAGISNFLALRSQNFNQAIQLLHLK